MGTSKRQRKYNKTEIVSDQASSKKIEDLLDIINKTEENIEKEKKETIKVPEEVIIAADDREKEALNKLNIKVEEASKEATEKVAKIAEETKGEVNQGKHVEELTEILNEGQIGVLIEHVNSIDELKNIIFKNNITVKGRSSDIIWKSSDIISTIDQFKQEVAPPSAGGIRIKVCELILKEDPDNTFAKKLLTKEGVKVEGKDDSIEEDISNTETKKDIIQEKSQDIKVQESIKNERLNEFFKNLRLEDLQDIKALKEKFNTEIMSDEVLNEMGLSLVYAENFRDRYFNNFCLQAETIMKEHIAVTNSKESSLKSGLKNEGKKLLKGVWGGAAYSLTSKMISAALPGIGLVTGGVTGAAVSGFNHLIGKGYNELNAKGLKKLSKKAEELKGKGLDDKLIFNQLKEDILSLIQFDKKEKELFEAQQTESYRMEKEDIDKYFSGNDDEEKKQKISAIQNLFIITENARNNKGEYREGDIQERQELIKELTANNALEEYITFQIDKKLEALKVARNLTEEELNTLAMQAQLMVSREMNVILGDVVAQEKIDEIDKSEKGSYAKSYISKLFGKTPPESLIQAIGKGFVSGSIASLAYTDVAAGAAYMGSQRFLGAFRGEVLKGSKSEVKTTKDILGEFTNFKLDQNTFSQAKSMISEARARIKLPDIKEVERAKIELRIEELQNKMILEIQLGKIESENILQTNEIAKKIVSEREDQISKAIDITRKEKERKNYRELFSTFYKMTGKEKFKILTKSGLEGLKGALYGALGGELVNAGSAFASGGSYDIDQGINNIQNRVTLNAVAATASIGETVKDIENFIDDFTSSEEIQETSRVEGGFKAMFPEVSKEADEPSWKWANDQDRDGPSFNNQAEKIPDFKEALIGTSGDKQFVDEVSKSFEPKEENSNLENESSEIKEGSVEYKQTMDKISAALEDQNSSHPEWRNPEYKESYEQLQEDFGINSSNSDITDEELNNIKEQLDGDKSEEAKALLEELYKEGKITEQQKFSLEHASIEAAGLVNTEENVNTLTLELGKGMAPKYLEQVFYRVGIDNMSFGSEGITNVEAAQILNVGANLRILSEGHDIAGITSEEFQKYVSIEDGKVTITNYDGFQDNIVCLLVDHAEDIITAENIENTGAVAYINNIKDTTWGDMLAPEGIEENNINLDQEEIEAAEERLFQETLQEINLGEVATEINFEDEDEDSGIFFIDNQEIEVDDNQVIRVSNTVLNEPILLESKESADKLIDVVSKVKASEFLASVGQNQENSNTEAEPPLPLVPEYDTKVALESTLNKLGFGSDHSKAEWEFIKHKPLDNLLDRKIEDYSKNNAKSIDNFLELHNRSIIREFMQDAIDKGDLVLPKDGGLATVEEGMKELIANQAREKLAHDIELAEKKVDSISETLGDQMREESKNVTEINQEITKLDNMHNISSEEYNFPEHIEFITTDRDINLMKEFNITIKDGVIYSNGKMVFFPDDIKNVSKVYLTPVNLQPDGIAEYLKFTYQDSKGELFNSSKGSVILNKDGLESYFKEDIPINNYDNKAEKISINTDKVIEELKENIEDYEVEETKVDKIENITTKDNIQATFSYDNEGEVISIHTEGSLAGYPESLNDEYRKIVINKWQEGNMKGDMQFHINKVEFIAREIDMDHNVLKTLEEQGKGDSLEANFIRESIERNINRYESRYGDIFNDGETTEIEQTATQENKVTITEVYKNLLHEELDINAIDQMNIQELQNLKIKLDTVNETYKETPPTNSELTSSDIKSLQTETKSILDKVENRLSTLTETKKAI